MFYLFLLIITFILPIKSSDGSILGHFIYYGLDCKQENFMQGTYTAAASCPPGHCSETLGNTSEWIGCATEYPKPIKGILVVKYTYVFPQCKGKLHSAEAYPVECACNSGSCRSISCNSTDININYSSPGPDNTCSNNDAPIPIPIGCDARSWSSWTCG